MSGVAAALEKNAGQTESKGVKAHFSMDDSGILAINLVESVFEKNTTDSDTGEGGVQDTLSKLGSAFSKLFSGSTEGEGNTEKPTDEEGDAAATNATTEEGTQQEEPAQQTNTTQQQTVNETDSTTANATATEEAPKKVKTVLVKEALDLTVNILDVPPLDGDSFKATAAK